MFRALTALDGHLVSPTSEQVTSRTISARGAIRMPMQVEATATCFLLQMLDGKLWGVQEDPCLYPFYIFINHFWVSRGLRMILSNRAPSSLNMSSYGTISDESSYLSNTKKYIDGFSIGSWVHDGFLGSRWVLGFTMDSWIHDRFLDSRWMIHDGLWFWVHKNVFTGGLPPRRPPAVPGGLPAPQTPWWGACSLPRPLAIF